MKSDIKGTVEGTLQKVKGTVNEMTGMITANHKLEAKGKAEKTAGSRREPAKKRDYRVA